MAEWRLVGSMCLVTAALASHSATSAAQNPSTIGTQGQSVTVQLPTFSFFTVSTTVVVPDRGSAYLGGVGQSRSTRAANGLVLLPGGGNVGTSNSGGASGISVSAWVHDFQAMDEALLATAAKRRGAAGEDTDSAIANVGSKAGAGSPLVSVADYEHQRAGADDAQQREIDQRLEKARGLRAAGKSGVARIYYQMALRRADGDLQRSIAAEMAEMSAAVADARER